jgi:hypothetical protein
MDRGYERRGGAGWAFRNIKMGARARVSAELGGVCERGEWGVLRDDEVAPRSRMPVGRYDTDLRRTRWALGDFAVVESHGVSMGVGGVRQGGKEWSTRGVEVVEEAQFLLALERDSVRRRRRSLGISEMASRRR